MSGIDCGGSDKVEKIESRTSCRRSEHQRRPLPACPSQHSPPTRPSPEPMLSGRLLAPQCPPRQAPAIPQLFSDFVKKLKDCSSLERIICVSVRLCAEQGQVAR